MVKTAFVASASLIAAGGGCGAYVTFVHPFRIKGESLLGWPCVALKCDNNGLGKLRAEKRVWSLCAMLIKVDRHGEKVARALRRWISIDDLSKRREAHWRHRC